MSIGAMTHCWDHAPVKGSALLLLLAIADSARDPDWVAWPAVRTLTTRTRLSERQVRYLLRELEMAGCIATEIEGSRAGTNLYRVLRTAGGLSLPPRAEGGLSTAPNGGKLAHDVGQPAAPNPLYESLMNQGEDDDPEIALADRMEARFQDQIDTLGDVRAAWLARHGIFDARSWVAVIGMPLGESPERTWARATRALKSNGA
jgi:hypothetical protein